MSWKASARPARVRSPQQVFGYLSDSARIDESTGRGARFVTTAVSSASVSAAVRGQVLCCHNGADEKKSTALCWRAERLETHGAFRSALKISRSLPIESKRQRFSSRPLLLDVLCDSPRCGFCREGSGHLSPASSADRAAADGPSRDGVSYQGLADLFYEFGGHRQTLRPHLPAR